jgi:hypothetical protein
MVLGNMHSLKCVLLDSQQQKQQQQQKHASCRALGNTLSLQLSTMTWAKSNIPKKILFGRDHSG